MTPSTSTSSPTHRGQRPRHCQRSQRRRQPGRRLGLRLGMRRRGHGSQGAKEEVVGRGIAGHGRHGRRVVAWHDTRTTAIAGGRARLWCPWRGILALSTRDLAAGQGWEWRWRESRLPMGLMDHNHTHPIHMPTILKNCIGLWVGGLRNP